MKNSKEADNNSEEIKENNLRAAAAPRRGAAEGRVFVFFMFYVLISNSDSTQCRTYSRTLRYKIRNLGFQNGSRSRNICFI